MGHLSSCTAPLCCDRVVQYSTLRILRPKPTIATPDTCGIGSYDACSWYAKTIIMVWRGSLKLGNVPRGEHCDQSTSTWVTIKGCWCPVRSQFSAFMRVYSLTSRLTHTCAEVRGQTHWITPTHMIHVYIESVHFQSNQPGDHPIWSVWKMKWVWCGKNLVWISFLENTCIVITELD